MIRIALVAACVLAVPGVAMAQAPKAANAQIAVMGQGQHDGRTVVFGPDPQGRYATRVNITDLDLATPAGRATAEHRVAWAASQLCSVTGDQGDLPGYYNAGARKCESQVREQADAALAGSAGSRSVAMLRLVAPAR